MSVKFQVFRQDAWFSLIQRHYSVSFITIIIHYVFSWFRPTIGPVQCISFGTLPLQSSLQSRLVCHTCIGLGLVKYNCYSVACPLIFNFAFFVGSKLIVHDNMLQP